MCSFSNILDVCTRRNLHLLSCMAVFIVLTFNLYAQVATPQQAVHTASSIKQLPSPLLKVDSLKMLLKTTPGSEQKIKLYREICWLYSRLPAVDLVQQYADSVQALAKKMETEFPDIEILYTRTSDIYPEIRARADFANANKGDLFLSIHANAAPPILHKKPIGYRNEVYYTGKGKKRKKHVRKVPKYQIYYTPNEQNGTETFIWAADRTDEKEKYVGTDLVSENNNIDTTEVIPDINDPASKAKALLWTKRYFNKSFLLASMMEEEFVRANRLSRGVKQRNEKGIWVLQATSMPSILIETGFVTYKEEEDFLNSENGQEEIAGNILNAVKRYRMATEGK